MTDHAERISRLIPGDVALLKGENWIGKGAAGLVYRSPQLSDEKRRLLISPTFDF